MIRTRNDDGVCVVTIDRPERRNALRPTDLDAIRTAVTETEQPVTYLHGSGDAFCAGADLDVIATLDDPAGFARRGQDTAAALEAADTVVVCGIDGAARGGGVELALGADLRIATPNATFAEPGVTFGLFGAWGGTVRLPRVMGEGEALDFALSGRVLDADTALRTGLVSRVVADPKRVADEIAEGKPDALQTVKARVRDRRDAASQEETEAAAFASLVAAHADSIAADRE